MPNLIWMKSRLIKKEIAWTKPHSQFMNLKKGKLTKKERKRGERKPLGIER